MLCRVISPDIELILIAKCPGDWEVVAMGVQTKLGQLSEETNTIPLTRAPYVGASLRFIK